MSSVFANHVVWITGAGSGIGEGMALAFARQGAKLALSGRRAEPLANVAKAIRDMGGEADIFVCDVTDDAAVGRTVADIVAKFGKLDVAVANAGMGVSGPFEKIKPEQWRVQFDINVFGAVQTLRHALPELRKTNGRAAVVGSVNGVVCFPNSSAYAASKFAIRGMALTLAMELHGSGVSMTLIEPGFVESDIAKVDNNGVLHPDRKETRPTTFMWPKDRAGDVCVRAIHQRKREFVFTRHGQVAAFLGRHCPGFVHWAITRFGGNQANKRYGKEVK